MQNAWKLCVKERTRCDFHRRGEQGCAPHLQHENSVSYDQAIRIVTQEKKDCTVMVIVDAVSRKYFTSETSWLWDIDFELLRADNVKRIILAGEYCYDLASRFSYCRIDSGKIKIIRDIGEAAEEIKGKDAGYV